MVFSFWVGLFGASLSFLIRLELVASFLVLNGGQFYNWLIFSHALVMVFFLLVPALIGVFGNSLITFFIFFSDLGSPRINSFGLLLFFVSLWFFIIFFSLVLGLVDCVFWFGEGDPSDPSQVASTSQGGGVFNPSGSGPGSGSPLHSPCGSGEGGESEGYVSGFRGHLDSFKITPNYLTPKGGAMPRGPLFVDQKIPEKVSFFRGLWLGVRKFFGRSG